jgi:hypothetical protein
MLSKAEALEKARKLPGPPAPGVVLTIKRIEVALAWLELHGLAGRPRWDGGVLVLNLAGSSKPVEE